MVKIFRIPDARKGIAVTLESIQEYFKPSRVN